MKYRRIAIYPGSFDPVTNGHLDILERSKKLFGKTICAVGVNSSKTPLFSLEEKLDMLHHTVPEGVEIDYFDGLLMDYAKKVKKRAELVIIVRGIRLITDVEYEELMFFNNSKLDDSGLIETVWLPSKQDRLHINSSVIRDVAKMNPQYIDTLDVPEYVKNKLKEKH